MLNVMLDAMLDATVLAAILQAMLSDVVHPMLYATYIGPLAIGYLKIVSIPRVRQTLSQAPMARAA
jgi:hypothetical protein